MFDSAQFYENEAWVGEAFAALLPARGLARADLFIISKVWTSAIHEGREAVICIACEVSKFLANVCQIFGGLVLGCIEAENESSVTSVSHKIT